MHTTLLLLLLVPAFSIAQNVSCPQPSCPQTGQITSQLNSLLNGLQSLNSTALSFQQLTPCDRTDCSGQGNCLGFKQLKLCLCDQGFLGASCEQIACTSASSCNSNGLCLGSTTSFFCLCNLGFMGQTCNQTFSIGK